MINANNAYNTSDLHSAEQTIVEIIDQTTDVIENNIGVVQNYILNKFSSYLRDNEKFISEYTYEYQYKLLSDNSKKIWVEQTQSVLDKPIPIIALNMGNSETNEKEIVPQIKNKLPKDLADVAINALRNNYNKILICIDYLADFCCNKSKYKDDKELKRAAVDGLFIHFISHERRHSYQDEKFIYEGRSEVSYAAMSLYNEIPSEVDANTYGILKAVAYIKEEYNV